MEDRSARGVVAAGHPATVAAAVGVLERGGNAYDAAIAAGFTAAVAEPGLSSLAGGGFLLARTAAGEDVLFDFFVDTAGRGRPAGGHAPDFTPVTVRFGGAEQVFNVGHGSVAVPGCLPGYLHVHGRLGRLDLADVLAPARRAAADGVALGEAQMAVVRLLEAIFRLTAEGRARYAPGGRLIDADEPVRNPELAAFLDQVAAGRVKGFGEPRLGQAIEEAMRRAGGLVTAQDFAAYEVVERTPLDYRFRHARVLTNPPPSFGGTLVSKALSALEHAGPPDPFGSPSRVRRLAGALDEAMRQHSAPELRATKGTTHVSVADADGNLAAMTTSNGSGSGVFLAGTGIMANNIMGEADLHPGGFHTAPAGQRIGSMMAPTILEWSGEAVALGSGGSERIRSALTQVVANLVDHGMSLVDAVHAPRIHWDGAVLQVEPGLPDGALAAAREDRPVNAWAAGDLYFGGVNAVSTAGQRVGDPRRGGTTGATGG